MQVHNTMVSIKTLRLCTKPCETGCWTSAVAAIFGTVPRPASFENKPRLAPCIMAAATPPPTICSRPNADLNIIPSAAGTSLMLVINMPTASAKYPTTITGTMTCDTAAKRRMPPNKTTAMTAVRTMPLCQVGMAKADSIELVTEYVWTALKPKPMVTSSKAE